MKVSRRTPAKINLYLEVGPRLDSGRHLINSVVVPVSVFDTVEVEIAESLSCSVVLSEKLRKSLGGQADQIARDLSTESNLAAKAAALYLREVGKSENVRIRIEKEIPLQGGLGGGSSDAAATLLAMNDLFDQPLGLKSLLSMAARIGSDVSALLLGAPAILTGTGEEIAACTLAIGLDRADLLLAKPPEGISTPEAYAALNRPAERDGEGLRLKFATDPRWVEVLRSLGVTLQSSDTTSRNLLTLKGELGNSPPASRSSSEFLERGARNDFAAAVGSQGWFIGGTAALKEAGSARVLLCGSGSCLCGFLPEEVDGAKAEQELAEALPGWWITRAKTFDEPIEVASAEMGR